MIKYYDRAAQKYEIEKVAGEKYLKWLYSSPVGMNFLNLFIKKKAFSYFYGKYCDRPISKKNIAKFIDNFNIDMSLCKKNVSDFTCFNDFFTRELKPEARSIDEKENVLISPADGRIFAYDNIDIESLIQVKGFTYSLAELIQNPDGAEKYSGGTCIIVRLCPTDYHRFHFIDSGYCEKPSKIDGYYYSVNPLPLHNISKLFCQNKREWSVFHTEHFDDVLYIEVGATCVGSIVQTFNPSTHIKKGQEKGYFKFGGSTVILFFKKDTVNIDKDILDKTNSNFETKVLMGERIGIKVGR